MKVKVIGSSCSWFDRNNTSFVIDDDIVLDVPSGAYKLLNREIDLKKIKCVLITHFHSDHFGDFHLLATMFMRQFYKNRKEKLRVYSPKSILEKLVEYNKLFYGADDECDPVQLSKNIDFIELSDGMQFEEGDYKVTAYRMEHGNPETYGFSFLDKNGQMVAFSADTIVCNNLHKMLDKSNFAFVEMSSTKPSKTHISIDDFEELTKKYFNTKMFVVHTSDECQQYAIDNNLNYVNDGDVFKF